MKLINVGLGRTGTTSLKAALEIIGFAPTFHTTDLIKNARQMDVWEAAVEGQPADWRAFFADYAVADWPAALFYEEIITAHPEAKVMLTVRDPEQWQASISGTLNQVMGMNLPIPRFQRLKKILETHAINGLFDGKMNDKAHMVRFFEQHVAAVKAFVPADNLLVYNVTEGWEPLCDFLEVSVPDEPFPRVNTRGGFKALVTRLFMGSNS